MTRKPKKDARRSEAPSGFATSPKWDLRLYVAGESPKSRAALANLERLCHQHLQTPYSIEVIDLKQRPELAKAAQIVAVPTLVRATPEPVRRIIGDLSDASRALAALVWPPPPALQGEA